MPNWCDNRVTISHSDKSKIDALVQAAKDGHMFNHVVPMPEALNISAAIGTADEELKRLHKENIEKYGYSDWYEFRLDAWGTKWDAAELHFEYLADNKVELFFDTAWSPPIPIYEALELQGFDVVAYFSEDGCGFCGKYESGEQFNFDHEELENNEDPIAQDVDAEYLIVERKKHFDEENAI